MVKMKRLLPTLHILLNVSPLIPRDLPLNKRLEILSPFFTPAIGKAVSIDPAEEQQRDKLAHPEQLRGYIQISPPRAFCFIIRRQEHQPDLRVCKAKAIPFTLEELDDKGWL